MKIDQFPEDIGSYILPEPTGQMSYRCLGCSRHFDINELLYICPSCGTVLMLEDTNFERYDHIDGPMWRKIFDYRRMCNNQSIKGIFRYYEFVAPIIPLEQVVTDAAQREILGDRAIVVKKLRPLPVEAIVRGYIIGSGWKDYLNSGKVCGIALPEGLQMADRLPEPLFTPSTKADIGEHDQNIDFSATVDLIGKALAEQVRDTSLKIYSECAEYALTRGIIIADTKFEFGLDDNGVLHIIDEMLTPDSSRFWPADQYRPGSSPPSFDKQFVRDYLETLDWDKTPPAPDLPDEIIEKTAEKYKEAERLLTGN